MYIEKVKLHDNPNAPEGTNGVFLYDTAYGKNLTLGQLAAAVCLRAAANLEFRSIAKTNELNRHNEVTKDLSDVVDKLAKVTLDVNVFNAGTDPEITEFKASWWSTYARLTAYGIANLPMDIAAYSKRMAAMDAIKQEISKRTQVAQEAIVDIQNFMNNREVAMTMANNLVRSLGQTKLNTAGRMR